MMVNMKMEPEREEMPGEVEMDGPLYPEGLCIELESDQLDALKMAPPAIGSKVQITADAVVSCVSMEQTQGGPEWCVTLQITDLEVITEATKNKTLLG
jgi:hypothetical protein